MGRGGSLKGVGRIVVDRSVRATVAPCEVCSGGGIRRLLVVGACGCRDWMVPCEIETGGISGSGMGTASIGSDMATDIEAWPARHEE